MNSDPHRGATSERDPLDDVPAEYYDVLRHPRRIRLLAVLGSRPGRLSLAELASAIVEREGDASTERARREVRVSLVHNHLPRLSEYGLVEWDRSTGAELVAELPVHPADLSALLERCEGDAGRQVLEALVDPVRMRIVSMLSASDQPLSIDVLASRLAARDVGPDSQERAKLVLHHVHLARLEDNEIVAFDADTGLVGRDGRVLSTHR